LAPIWSSGAIQALGSGLLCCGGGQAPLLPFQLVRSLNVRWLAGQPAPACWPEGHCSQPARAGPGAPQAPRPAREALEAPSRVVRSRPPGPRALEGTGPPFTSAVSMDDASPAARRVTDPALCFYAARAISRGTLRLCSLDRTRGRRHLLSDGCLDNPALIVRAARVIPPARCSCLPAGGGP